MPEPQTLLIISAEILKSDAALQCPRYLATVAYPDGTERSLIVAKSVLEQARGNNNVLRVKPPVDPAMEARPPAHFCKSCRMVNSHDESCDAGNRYLIPIPHGVRVPKRDASRRIWIEFFQKYPAIRHSVLAA